MDSKEDVPLKRPSEYEPTEEPSTKKSRVYAQYGSSLTKIGVDQEGVIPSEDERRLVNLLSIKSAIASLTEAIADQGVTPLENKCFINTKASVDQGVTPVENKRFINIVPLQRAIAILTEAIADPRVTPVENKCFIDTKANVDQGVTPVENKCSINRLPMQRVDSLYGWSLAKAGVHQGVIPSEDKQPISNLLSIKGVDAQYGSSSTEASVKRERVIQGVDAQYGSSSTEACVERKGVIPIKNECFINQLPIEVLEIILNKINLNRFHRNNLRLVCKLWHTICNRRIGELRFIWRRMEDEPDAFERIGDFQFERFKLFFGHNNDVARLPLTIWEKMGVKILSIEFCFCRIGDELMKTIIQFCENLRFLRIRMRFRRDDGPDDLNVMLWTPEILESLNVTRRSLEKFEIIVCRPTDNSFYAAWENIFKALFRVFPCVIHYSITCNSKKFNCTLSKLYREADACKMPSILTRLLSDNSKYPKAVEELSAVRLFPNSFIHRYGKLLTEAQIKTTIFDFFNKQKELKSIELLDLGRREKRLIKDLMLHILDTSRQSLHLNYKLSEDVSSSFLLHTLTTKELSRLCASMLKVDKLVTESFSFIHERSLMLINSPDCSWKTIDESIHSNINLGLKLLVPHITFVRHLDVAVNVSDETLQIIFKYLTDLKSLKLQLSFENSNFGLLGHSDDDIIKSGYSIGRLQNLEELTLNAKYCTEENKWSIDDAVFSGFHLSKLYYLRSFSPSNSFDFRSFGTNFPRLKTIHFTSCPWYVKLGMWKSSEMISLESVASLCRYSRNLHTIEIIRVKTNVNFKTAKEIFRSCRTLKYLHIKQRLYYYDPLTNDLTFKIKYHY